MNSNPFTHFALFQPYRFGTTRRSGPPCASASGAPSCSPGEEHIVVGDHIEREIRRVAAVAVRHHMRDVGTRLDKLHYFVECDALPGVRSLLHWVTQ